MEMATCASQARSACASLHRMPDNTEAFIADPSSSRRNQLNARWAAVYDRLRRMSDGRTQADGRLVAQGVAAAVADLMDVMMDIDENIMDSAYIQVRRP